MTTEMIIIHIFYLVDNGLLEIARASRAKLYPSEVVTIGILFALKGGHFRGFYRWLKRDYEALFYELRVYEHLTDRFLADPTVLNVADTLPIELIFPIRAGRSQQQLGTKGRDKGRWSVGVKMGWILNQMNELCGWAWDGMNVHDNHFLEWMSEYEEIGIVLTDFGFRCAAGVPANIKLCAKGTWNDRMSIETSFPCITVLSQAKKIFHRQAAYVTARFAYLAAMYNVLRTLFQQLHPDEPKSKISFAEFSL
jgi:hypothetical protein